MHREEDCSIIFVDTFVFLPLSCQDSTPHLTSSHLTSPHLTSPHLTPNCGLVQTLADISSSEPTTFSLKYKPAFGSTSNVTLCFNRMCFSNVFQSSIQGSSDGTNASILINIGDHTGHTRACISPSTLHA